LPAADLPTIDTGTRDLLVDAVREAGAIALKSFRGSIKQWAKGQSSVVSEVDLAVDLLLRERLTGSATGTANGIAWLSEETEDDRARLAARAVWIVDPIDGTRSYLAGREDWAVSAALAVDGRPALAALFAPATADFFLSVAGAGATVNGVPIAVNPGASLAGSKASGPKRFVTWLTEIDPQMVAMPRIGSLALRLARVAQGTLDVAFAGGNSHDWDLAAADLLVHEAGGALTTLTGQVLTYNRPEPVHGALIAAGRDRHAPLLKRVHSLRADSA
jgi:myo-inositol-1(or 4)-monophosphatase